MDIYKSISRLYHKLRILSFDIVLGALSGGVMAVKVLDVQPRIIWWPVLALAVWIIYTADHLIDANKLKTGASSGRRYFYYKYFCLIVIIEIVLLIITASLSFLFFDKKIIYFGVAMGIFVTVYLLLVQIKGSEKQVWLQKELIVAIVYTVGIWAEPFIESNKIELAGILIVFLFFISVWADILLIAFFEYEHDKQDRFISLPIIIGKKSSMVLIKVLFVFSMFIALFVLFLNQDRNIMFAALILLIMDMVLLISLKYQRYLIENERYRIMAESVFLLPAVMLLL